MTCRILDNDTGRSACSHSRSNSSNEIPHWAFLLPLVFVVPTALLDPVDSETIQQLRSEVPGAPVLPKPVLRNGQAMGLSLLPTNKLHHRFKVGSQSRANDERGNPNGYVS